MSPYFGGETLDDVMRSVIEAIQSHGIPNQATKGDNTELTGVLLEISNPRTRLSRTESRGKPFSCLGELCWYLAKSNDPAFISYYLPSYEELAEKNVIFGAYGPRLFNWKDVDQVENVTNLLKNNRESRRAVIQLFDATDLAVKHKDIPCTCTLQFAVREGALHLLTYMRSNDVILGLPHDVFCFTMLQEIIARTLSIELGTYKHVAGSIHLYDRNREDASEFLDEGWQSTKTPMPSMPLGDPWEGVQSLLAAESAIRTDKQIDSQGLDELDPYWGDLVRLLQVFRLSKEKNTRKIKELSNKMSWAGYRPFIDKRLSGFQGRRGK